MNEPIKSYSREGIAQLVSDLGLPRFRAQQIYEWVYVRGAQSWDEMTNLPIALRSRMADTAPLHAPSVLDEAVSVDGTHKYLVEYHDGVAVETVAIPSRDNTRLTVCFSTQAGCAMACSFCATGQEGFTRNLMPGEIVDQIHIVQHSFGKRVTNLVAMGQGEPFLNYDNTLAALRILNDPKGIGIGARRISVSTCGIIPGINRLATEPEQFTLAVSLHSALQKTRDDLMPRMSKMPLPELREAIKSYIAQTNRRVTFEYIMIDGVNDTDEHLRALLSYCSHLLCHVNLIPINRIEGSSLQPTRRQKIDGWIHELAGRGIEATLRDSRGGDIAGACGQLKNTYSQRHN